MPKHIDEFLAVNVFFRLVNKTPRYNEQQNPRKELQL